MASFHSTYKVSSVSKQRPTSGKHETTSSRQASDYKQTAATRRVASPKCFSSHHHQFIVFRPIRSWLLLLLPVFVACRRFTLHPRTTMQWSRCLRWLPSELESHSADEADAAMINFPSTFCANSCSISRLKLPLPKLVRLPTPRFSKARQKYAENTRLCWICACAKPATSYNQSRREVKSVGCKRQLYG
jgi:hypothetical protein